MTKNDQLREMVATMLMVPTNEISAETTLAKIDTSLGGAQLKLGLKRLGLSLPPGPSPATFGQLEAAISGNSLTHPRSDISSSESTAVNEVPKHGGMGSLNRLQVGLDVQHIGALPAASDFWTDPFYGKIFGKPEIAYAVLQSEPRTHLAGFWCAKEALRKCDPSFMQTSFEETVVKHDSDGKPYLLWENSSGSSRLPHALSLSHTHEIATAVVVFMPSALEPKQSNVSPPLPPTPLPADPADRPKLSRPMAFVFAALVVLFSLVGYLIAHHYWKV